MNLKQELYKSCIAFVNNRLQTIETVISGNQKALEIETKSSAGDKHETGRAMLQLEMEKAGQQLASVQQMQETLSKINSNSTNTSVCLGSIVYTNMATYFISISAGKIVIDNETYFAISTSSPIGKTLLGKQADNQLVFNNQNINIKKVV